MRLESILGFIRFGWRGPGFAPGRLNPRLWAEFARFCWRYRREIAEIKLAGLAPDWLASKRKRMEKQRGKA